MFDLPVCLLSIAGECIRTCKHVIRSMDVVLDEQTDITDLTS